MFSEILRIKPVLDSASAKQMEATLSGRFQTVAKRFGMGLKSVIKGTVIGLSLGLLAQLLNPLENLEKKIKALLGEGEDLRDLAERFGTKEGKLRETQALAQSVGVSPDKFRDMLTSFANAVETAREEMKTPQGIQSANAKVVEQFVNEPDLLQGFYGFLAALKAEGTGPGRNTTLAGGTELRQSGADARREMEKAVFGDAQFGAAKRLINLDFEKQAASLALPSTGEFQAAAKKTGKLADVQFALDARNQADDFVKSASAATEKMVRDLEARQQLAEERARKDFDRFENLAKGARAIDDLAETLKGTQDLLLQGLNLLNDAPKLFGVAGTISNSLSNLSDFVFAIKRSRWFKGIQSGGE